MHIKKCFEIWFELLQSFPGRQFKSGPFCFVKHFISQAISLSFPLCSYDTDDSCQFCQEPLTSSCNYTGSHPFSLTVTQSNATHLTFQSVPTSLDLLVKVHIFHIQNHTESHEEIVYLLIDICKEVPSMFSSFSSYAHINKSW